MVKLKYIFPTMLQQGADKCVIGSLSYLLILVHEDQRTGGILDIQSMWGL